MRSLHVQGDSPLHRTASAAKLLGLAAFAALLFASAHPAWLGIMLLLAACAYLSVGQPWRAACATLLPLLYPIIAVGLFNVVFNGAGEATVTVLRLVSLLLAAMAVTLTTAIADFIETVTRAAAPLERLGLLKAADIGLAVGLVLRFVPEIVARYGAIREAHVARGVKLRILTLIAPLIILTLKDADNIAAAIDARGIRGPKV